MPTTLRTEVETLIGQLDEATYQSALGKARRFVKAVGDDSEFDAELVATYYRETAKLVPGAITFNKGHAGKKGPVTGLNPLQQSVFQKMLAGRWINQTKGLTAEQYAAEANAYADNIRARKARKATKEAT